VEVGGEFLNWLVPKARGDEAAIKPLGTIPTWQFSQVVEVGMCAVAPLNGGIAMMELMP
jgi:hypothetical protein